MLALLLLACDPDGNKESSEVAFDCEASGNICTWAGNGMAGLGAEGAKADETFFYLPQDLTFGPDGNAYVLDWNNHRVRQILTADHTIHTVAGTGELGDGPEGPATAARFNHPTNVAFRDDGLMFIAAWHNSRVITVDLATGDLKFFCGDGKRKFSGDGGPCSVAQLDLPSSVAFDAEQNLYVTDMANQRIRRVSPDGTINTWGFTGEAGYGGDGGPVSTAQMHATAGQAADPANRIVISGNFLYMADTENHCIREVDLTTGIVETVAGKGSAGTLGDGGPATEAQLFLPRDVAVGADGELYIADTDNSCVRMVDTAGTISTVAGICGRPGYEGDGASAKDALLQHPFGIELDSAGNLYIADTYNNVIRVVKK